MNFTGKVGEEMSKNYFESIGYEVEEAPKKVFYDWDLKCVSNNREFTVEVKYDSKAYLWAKRRGTPNAPNLYIEFKNTNQDKDSGILMSKADYYLYIIKDGAREMGYIFIREQLLKHLQESDYKVVGNSASGDDNALGWIPPLNSLTNIDYGFRGTIDLTNYVY